MKLNPFTPRIVAARPSAARVRVMAVMLVVLALVASSCSTDSDDTTTDTGATETSDTVATTEEQTQPTCGADSTGTTEVKTGFTYVPSQATVEDSATNPDCVGERRRVWGESAAAATSTWRDAGGEELRCFYDPGRVQELVFTDQGPTITIDNDFGADDSLSYVVDTINSTPEMLGRIAPVIYLTVAPGWKFGPGNDPLPVSAGSLDANSASGTPVVVLDTGTGSGAMTDNPFAGHGTFIEGVIDQIGDGIPVTLVDIGQGSGLLDEHALYKTLTDTDPPEGASTPIGLSPIINMSFGTYGCEMRYEGSEPIKLGDSPEITAGQSVLLMPLSLVAAFRVLADGPGAQGEQAIVAAAGNDDVETPFYPAAFSAGLPPNVAYIDPDEQPEVNGFWEPLFAGLPMVVAVGASDGPASTGCADPPKAPFSNCAEAWTSVLVDGVDIVSTYPYQGFRYCIGQGQCETGAGLVDVNDAPSATFDGAARWSGTSFAAPCFAAHLAIRHASGGTVFEARDRLLGDELSSITCPG